MILPIKWDICLLPDAQSVSLWLLTVLFVNYLTLLHIYLIVLIVKMIDGLQILLL